MLYIAILALILAIGACALIMVLLRLMKQPRAGWEAVGAALLLGVAGYGMQGSPGLPGAPKEPVERVAGNSAEMVEARKSLDVGSPSDNKWSVIADAFARNGQYADAAGVLLGAVDKQPANSDAWLALANALVGHAEGTLSPAALYAYRHAAEAAPAHRG